MDTSVHHLIHFWGWFNIKMPSYQYKKSRWGDNTILWLSYLHNGISYTGKLTSLYWIMALLSKSDKWSSSIFSLGNSHCIFGESFIMWDWVRLMVDNELAWDGGRDDVRGIHWSPVNFPHKGQWHRALRFSLICAWTKGWVNNQDAGAFRGRHTHYDITVMGWLHK